MAEPYPVIQTPGAQYTQLPQYPPYAHEPAYGMTYAHPHPHPQPQMIVNVQQTTPMLAPAKSKWTYDLCDCCKNSSTCCYAWWCLPCLASENSHRLDGGGPEECVSLCYPANFCKNRVQAKKSFGIEESTCDSCCIVGWCTLCSEIQIANELDARRGAPSRIVTV